jgi:hypothetical protein
MDKNAQVDPLKIVTRLREKLSSSMLQEAVLETMLADGNALVLQLRDELASRMEELTAAQERITELEGKDSE